MCSEVFKFKNLFDFSIELCGTQFYFNQSIVHHWAVKNWISFEAIQSSTSFQIRYHT